MPAETVRESIQRARDELEGAVSVADTVVEQAESAVETGGGEPEATSAAAPAAAEGERLRGPDGKFAAKAAADTSVAAPVTTAPPRVPKNWETGERRTVWDAFTDDQRKHLLEREDGIEKFVTTANEDRAFAKSMRDTIAPFEALIRAEGSDPQTAVRSLLETAAFLRTAQPEQKRQLILNLAAQYGVSLGQAEPAAQFHPEVEYLRNSVQSIAQWAQRQEQQSQKRQLDDAQSAIDAFTKDHPLFASPEVRSQAGLLLANGAAATLEQAYDMAVWSHPETRSQLIAQQSEKAKADQIAKANQKKSAAVSTTGSPNGSRVQVFEPKPGESVRDTINRTRLQLSASA